MPGKESRKPPDGGVCQSHGEAPWKMCDVCRNKCDLTRKIWKIGDLTKENGDVIE